MLSANTSLAQQQSSELSKGDPAPFDCTCVPGVTSEDVALVSVTADKCAERQAVEVAKVVRSMEIDVAECETKRANAAEAFELKHEIKNRPETWYVYHVTHPLLVSTAYVVATYLAIEVARRTVVLP